MAGRDLTCRHAGQLASNVSRDAIGALYTCAVICIADNQSKTRRQTADVTDTVTEMRWINNLSF